MKFGIVTFPGSNCDHDMNYVFGDVLHREVVSLWHKDTALNGFDTNDCIVLPGGFSYGDYLRCGALARLSPIMQAVVEFANAGGYVLGICNGFQILCESGLLPGVLLRNSNQKFISKNVFLKTGTTNTALTSGLDPDQPLQMPIAHAEGNFFAEANVLKEIIDNDQVIFRYCDAHGKVSAAANPNGTLDNIAGICNKGRNVFGMMPHPERASESVMGCSDGLKILESLVAQSLVI